MLDKFQKQLEYTFTNKNLLRIALTRRAAIEEGLALPIEGPSSSQLKFLGSRVLNLLVANLIFTTSLFKSEGDLTQKLIRILRHDGLIVDAAKRINLDKVLIMGSGEKLNQVNQNDRVLAAHMQILFGAIWLDSNGNYAYSLKVLLTCFGHADILRKGSLGMPESFFHSHRVPESNLLRLQQQLQYRFSHMPVLIQALTRQSALEETVVEEIESSFQTLEFLGDKVLGCVIADILMERFPQYDSDSLSPILDCLTNNYDPLARVAKAIGLDSALIMGYGEEKVRVRVNIKKLSDHMEAVIAAVWVDSDCQYQIVKSMLSRLFQPLIKELVGQSTLNDGLAVTADNFPVLGSRGQTEKAGRPSESFAEEARVSYAETALRPAPKQKGNRKQPKNGRGITGLFLSHVHLHQKERDERPLHETARQTVGDVNDPRQFPSLSSSNAAPHAMPSKRAQPSWLRVSSVQKTSSPSNSPKKSYNISDTKEFPSL